MIVHEKSNLFLLVWQPLPQLRRSSAALNRKPTLEIYLSSNIECIATREIKWLYLLLYRIVKDVEWRSEGQLLWLIGIASRFVLRRAPFSLVGCA